MSVGCTCIITHAAKTVKRNLFWKAVIFCGEIKKCFSVLVASNEPQANKKFFDPTIFQKCWRGVGEQPTFAEQTCFQELFFLMQLHFLKLSNLQLAALYETSFKFGQGNGAIAARWQAKAGVEPPFAGRGRPFSLRKILLGIPLESGSAESLRCLPVCCSPVVALSELPMNLS